MDGMQQKTIVTYANQNITCFPIVLSSTATQLVYINHQFLLKSYILYIHVNPYVV